MSDGFPLRCIGLIDDYLIGMSVTKIEKIRSERRVRFFSSAVASLFLVVAISIGALGFNKHIETSNGSIIEDLDYCVIDDTIYMIVSSSDYEKYGFSDKPNASMIGEFVGEYRLQDSQLLINVYSATFSPTGNFLLAECAGELYYMTFEHKVGFFESTFYSAADFLEFYGYTSEADIISLVVDGEPVKNRETIANFWEAIYNSEVNSMEDYDLDFFQGDKLNDIVLNDGTTNRLEISYSDLGRCFEFQGFCMKIT